MIIPSIDIMSGKAVQLIQGDPKRKQVEIERPFDLARKFNRIGEIAVIDLDSAFMRGGNEELVQQICQIADCRVGGGIRSVDKAERVLGYGAKKIIIGTKATPDFLSVFDRKRVIVALDVKDGNVAIDGWRKKTERTAIEKMEELADYCTEFLVTDINNEGTMQGINFDFVEKISAHTENQITYAGGISQEFEILRLEEMEINSQLGMSIYTGKIQLQDLFVNVLNFSKCNGKIPTIVQDADSGKVLMLAYSTPGSLKKTLGDLRPQAVYKQTQATYFSRSRNKLWVKGEKSGNFQEFIKARYDCDRDTLLFTVRQKGQGACHRNTETCFQEQGYNLNKLFSIINERAEGRNEESYTWQLLNNNEMLKEKIKEEMNELLNFENRENLIWETADLLYFVLVFLRANGGKFDQVIDELWRRNR